MSEPSNGSEPRCLRIAASGDLHCDETRADEVRAAVERLEGAADVLLLAGDLTTLGEPEQAAPLADACSRLDIPVIAVLGNHDWHAGRAAELVKVLESGGIELLDRSCSILDIDGHRVGVVGVKGFVGGFAGSHLPDFGEPLLREVYAETSREVDALDQGLREIELCPVRLVVLHYSPTEATIMGEARGIWSFLGCDRLAGPIAEHEPDLVVHGHAHGGSFEGSIGRVPVYNVAVQVTGRDFWLFEIDDPSPARLPIR